MAEKKPPMIKRDEHNKVIDADEGRRIAADLTKKFLAESKHFEKDNSMHLARTGKRDIVVHIAVTVLGQVNGVNIVGDKPEREVGQWCFRLNAKNLPLHSRQIYQPLSELANLAKKAMMSIGAIIS